MHMKAMVILQSTLDEKFADALNQGAGESKPQEYSTGSSLMQLIGLIVILIIILVAAYYTTRYIGRLKQGQLKNSNFDVIDTYRISQNKLLQIIKIGNKYIVIAVSKDNINYITELDETQVLTKEVNAGEKQGLQSFKQIFEKLKNNK